MHASGVRGKGSPHRAGAFGGKVHRKKKPLFGRRILKVFENHAALNNRGGVDAVNGLDLVHAGGIDKHRAADIGISNHWGGGCGVTGVAPLRKNEGLMFGADRHQA